MPNLFMDCRFGIAGDMFLAALAGLGLDLAPLEQALGQAGIKVRLGAPEVRVNGLAGRRLNIEIDKASDQPLRHLPEILKIIEAMPLSKAVKQAGAKAFTRLGQTEASVHGVDLSDIHFHEVGAVDTVVDVMGALWGVETLGFEHVICSPLPWFTGSVACAHGTLSLPAPATLELMKEKPVFPTDFTLEIVTPTGALIADQVAHAYGPGFEGVVRDTATAFGSHDLGDNTGGLRLVSYEAARR